MAKKRVAKKNTGLKVVQKKRVIRRPAHKTVVTSSAKQTVTQTSEHRLVITVPKSGDPIEHKKAPVKKGVARKTKKKTGGEKKVARKKTPTRKKAVKKAAPAPAPRPAPVRQPGLPRKGVPGSRRAAEYARQRQGRIQGEWRINPGNWRQEIERRMVLRKADRTEIQRLIGELSAVERSGFKFTRLNLVKPVNGPFVVEKKALADRRTIVINKDVILKGLIHKRDIKVVDSGVQPRVRGDAIPRSAAAERIAELKRRRQQRQSGST